jgi:UDP-N-acetylmuramate dehydrogenase
MIIKQNVHLKPYNTFGIDVLAKYFATFSNITELQELLNYNKECLIIGGGSNMLFTNNINKLVLKNEILGIDIEAQTETYVIVKAGAGVNWHQLVLYCTNNNWGGLENLSLIPGCVGASPIQNIGAYGVELKDSFYELEAINIETGKIQVFTNADCTFGYRESIFKQQQYKGKFVITAVSFKLQLNPTINTTYGAIEQELAAMQLSHTPTIKDISNAVINIRKSKLPNPQVIGNAGSFFKNPEVTKSHFEALQKIDNKIVGYPLTNGNVKLAAGWLIEQCGFKGYRQGDAGVHAKQALVLVNYGSATGQQIVALSNNIIDTVNKKFNVLLQQEVNIM